MILHCNSLYTSHIVAWRNSRIHDDYDDDEDGKNILETVTIFLYSVLSQEFLIMSNLYYLILFLLTT